MGLSDWPPLDLEARVHALDIIRTAEDFKVRLLPLFVAEERRREDTAIQIDKAIARNRKRKGK